MARMALFVEFISDAMYQGDLSQEFENLIQANHENVGTYTRNLQFFVQEMFTDTHLRSMIK